MPQAQSVRDYEIRFCGWCEQEYYVQYSSAKEQKKYCTRECELKDEDAGK